MISDKIGSPASGQVIDSPSTSIGTLSPEKGKLVSRDVEHLNGKAQRRRRACRCNILQTIVVAIAAYILYRNFVAGATEVAGPGMSGVVSRALQMRGILRQQPGMVERGELRNDVRAPQQQQQALPQQLPERGELRNGVRSQQHGLQERGDLRRG